MLLKLAWRNLWRNKRRTLITLASIFFAVILSTFMVSLKEGFYKGMIDSMVGAFTGYAQIHATGYWADKTLENSFEFNDSLAYRLKNANGLSSYAPRVESFALAASSEITRVTMVVGIDPKKEMLHTDLQDRVIEGEYLQEKDQGALLGDALAKYLKVGVGDTLVLLGQGYHGASAAGKYPIKGIVKFGSPELSKQLVFLSLQATQKLFDVEGRLTNLILLPYQKSETDELVQSLQSSIGNGYEVMAWQELTPEIINMMETEKMEGYVFMFILYMVISFGIFATILMMMAERMHEFGVLVAVGMKRINLAMVMILEILSISILGAFLGMLGALPICLYFYYYPIKLGAELEEMVADYGMEAVLQASISPNIFIQQAIIVGLIGCAIAIYPLWKISRLDAINAMRS